MLNEANSADVIDGIRQLYSKEPIFEIVQLNCALAAIRLEEARLQRDPSLFDKAQQHVEAAKAVRSGEMLPDMMQGLLELSKVWRQLFGGCVAVGGQRPGRTEVVRAATAAAAARQHQQC